MRSCFSYHHCSKFPFIVRIISAILVISFIIYDISWANPDFSYNNNANADKLAPQSIFKNPSEETIDRFIAALLYEKIEDERSRIGMAADAFNIDVLSAILKKLENDDPAWFKKFSIRYTVSHSRYEALIYINNSNILRYYSYNSPKSRLKYSHKVIAESPVPVVTGGMHIQYVRVNALPAAESPSRDVPKNKPGPVPSHSSTGTAPRSSPGTSLIMRSPRTGSAALERRAIFYACLACTTFLAAFLITGEIKDISLLLTAWGSIFAVSTAITEWIRLAYRRHVMAEHRSAEEKRRKEAAGSDDGGCIGKYESFEIDEIKHLGSGRVEIAAKVRMMGVQESASITLTGRIRPLEGGK